MNTTTAILACLGLLATAATATAVPPPLYPGDPGGTCVGTYNQTSFANVCAFTPGPHNITVPVEVGYAQQGTLCPIGGICIPIYGIEFVYGAGPVEPPVGIYVELLCNQPTAPCGCTAPYIIEACSPFILPN